MYLIASDEIRGLNSTSFGVVKRVFNKQAVCRLWLHRKLSQIVLAHHIQAFT